MSLKPTAIAPVPTTTAQVTRAAFPHGNIYLTLRDALELSFTMQTLQICTRIMGSPGGLHGVWLW
jgi:hypothetical protein